MAITTKATRIYKDIDLSFSKNAVSKDVGRKVDIGAVKQGMKNVIYTSIGERLFNPGFGSQMREMLFEPVDNASASVISKLITQCLENYEKRIVTDASKVDVKANEKADGYHVTVVFSILGIADKQRLEIVLERLR